MLPGAGYQAWGPGPGSRRQEGHGSLVEARAEAPRKGARREDPRSRRPSPSPGGSAEDQTSRPSWAAGPGQEETLPSTPAPPSPGCEPATGPLARLNRRREARLPFSRFLDEVTVQVLDPGTLEAFQGPRGRSPEPSPGERGPGLAQEPLPGAAAPERTVALSTQPCSEAAAKAADRLGSRPAVETSGMHAGSGQQGGQAASPWQPPSRASAADMDKLRALQEQKGDLRKRLTYTTNRLEKLENNFGSTRNYLEVELRRAQEELEKVTEKLLRIQNNYMSLQRINQELEEKLFRMGQNFDEEKRSLTHEIVALNGLLMDAKMTIQKLMEDNERFRRDCNLAAQLLQCSQIYGRVYKVSELPEDFQERLILHLEKHGCSLPSAHCGSGFADTVPLCIIAKVLEKPEPSSLSSAVSAVSVSVSVSDASAGDLALPPHKATFCCDVGLCCREEPPADRRPSVDAALSDLSFLQAQVSTDSTAGEEEEEEAGAAAYPAEFRREAFPGYSASLPTSSSYSSFSATSEEREPGQAGTLTTSQPASYLSGRQQLFQRPPPPAYQAPEAPLEAEVAPEFELERPFSPYLGEYGHQGQTLVSPSLWSLRAKPGSGRMPRGEARSPRGQWRALNVEEAGAYPRRPSPRNYYGGGSPRNQAPGRNSPLYANYRADSFLEGDDFSEGHLAEPCFLRAAGPADTMPGYGAGEGHGERPRGQLFGVPHSELEPSLLSSRDSLEPSSEEGSPEMHPAACRSPQPAYARARGAGLNRKDSLTKAQLYGTLLN